jgi:hypothetical protein
MSATMSEQHPHEPEIPPALDGEGRCLVCRLFVALEDACDVAVWMSGSPTFGPDGEGHEAWVSEMRPKLFKALDALGKRGPVEGAVAA